MAALALFCATRFESNEPAGSAAAATHFLNIRLIDAPALTDANKFTEFLTTILIVSNVADLLPTARAFG